MRCSEIKKKILTKRWQRRTEGSRYEQWSVRLFNGAGNCTTRNWSEPWLGINILPVFKPPVGSQRVLLPDSLSDPLAFTKPTTDFFALSQTEFIRTFSQVHVKLFLSYFPQDGTFREQCCRTSRELPPPVISLVHLQNQPRWWLSPYHWGQVLHVPGLEAKHPRDIQREQHKGATDVIYVFSHHT